MRWRWRQFCVKILVVSQLGYVLIESVLMNCEMSQLLERINLNCQSFTSPFPFSCRSSTDSEKLTATHVTTSRGGPMALDRSRNESHLDDDDKLLDVVGPSQSPLLPLSHSLQQLQAHPHSGKLTQTILRPHLVAIFCLRVPYLDRNCTLYSVVCSLVQFDRRRGSGIRS